ncbi:MULTISPECIES: hypothetical protein [Microbacterium]|nr:MULTISPECIES: hypothetical protein [Microbacterium]MCP1427867.1 hypothetical protein [Microbacterium foliorum]
MTISTVLPRSERLRDASVVTTAVDIAGARHEVLPPRLIALRGLPISF